MILFSKWNLLQKLVEEELMILLKKYYTASTQLTEPNEFNKKESELVTERAYAVAMAQKKLLLWLLGNHENGGGKPSSTTPSRSQNSTPAASHPSTPPNNQQNTPLASPSPSNSLPSNNLHGNNSVATTSSPSWWRHYFRWWGIYECHLFENHFEFFLYIFGLKYFYCYFLEAGSRIAHS